MIEFIQDHIDKLPLSSEETKKYQAEAWRSWVQYIEPGDEQELASPTKKGRGGINGGPGGEPEEELELEPLPEGTLTRNLGLDLIVVVTKTDILQSWRKILIIKMNTLILYSKQ